MSVNLEKSRSGTDVPHHYLRYVLFPTALKHNQLIGLRGVCVLIYLSIWLQRRAGKSGLRTIVFAAIIVLCFQLLMAADTAAQTSDSEKPVPLLSGSAGYFNFVTAGQNQIDAQINPVLLLPLGDRWLVEGRMECEGAFQRPDSGGPYGGQVSKNLDYLEADYIANPHLTVTLGRFLTPFGIFNERLYPIWIRSLQQDPLILPLSAESNDGMMLRGGFPATAKANFNYAAYVSAISTGHSNLQSNRDVGGRMAFFFPGPRIEVGASFQKLLQDTRTNSFGFHFAWLSARLPLNVHSEYARSNQGSGYWVDGAYRLSQLHFWQKAMRRTELAGRAEQFFLGSISSDDAQALGLQAANTREGEFGLNYYLQDGLRIVASYGRQFSSAGNLNLWTVGITYRFVFPLGRVGQGMSPRGMSPQSMGESGLGEQGRIEQRMPEEGAEAQ